MTLLNCSQKQTVESDMHKIRVHDEHPAVLTCVVCEFGDGILKVYVAVKVVSIECTPPTVLKVTLSKVYFFLQVTTMWDCNSCAHACIAYLRSMQRYVLTCMNLEAAGVDCRISSGS